MKVILVVMCTTWAVVKIRHEKNSGLYGTVCRRFQFGPRNMTGRELIAEHTIVLFRLSLNAIAGVFP